MGLQIEKNGGRSFWTRPAVLVCFGPKSPETNFPLVVCLSLMPVWPYRTISTDLEKNFTFHELVLRISYQTATKHPHVLIFTVLTTCRLIILFPICTNILPLHVNHQQLLIWHLNVFGQWFPCRTEPKPCGRTFNGFVSKTTCHITSVTSFLHAMLSVEWSSFGCKPLPLSCARRHSRAWSSQKRWEARLSVPVSACLLSA